MAERVKSIIVVGGGVIGMNCALSLQARGIAVTVLDPAALRPASLGAVALGGFEVRHCPRWRFGPVQLIAAQVVEVLP